MYVKDLRKLLADSDCDYFYIDGISVTSDVGCWDCPFNNTDQEECDLFGKHNWSEEQGYQKICED